MTEAHARLTGGCQCGAIRFALTAAPIRISICHCRMCQKATGAPFASLADIKMEHFSWTRGTPATFNSSSMAERGFCRNCGTPLHYRAFETDRIEIMTSAFDRPDRVVPTLQYGSESRLGWLASIAAMPSRTTLENYGAEKTKSIVSHQHPDHD